MTAVGNATKEGCGWLREVSCREVKEESGRTSRRESGEGDAGGRGVPGVRHRWWKGRMGECCVPGLDTWWWGACRTALHPADKEVTSFKPRGARYPLGVPKDTGSVHRLGKDEATIAPHVVGTGLRFTASVILTCT